MTRPGGIERRLREDLGEARAPGEEEAAARVRARVLAAHAAAAVAAPARRGRLRPAAVAVAATLVAVAVAAVGLSAPGQAVGDWLRDVVEPRRAATPAPPPKAALPAGGRVLAAAAGGVSVAGPEGDPVRLGDYREAVWSPRGRFVAVTTSGALLAVTPAGDVRWRVVPPATPRRPAWSPDGFRLAYLAGLQLRVVVGDGTDDRLFYGHARDVGPAFRPTAGRTVAWVDDDGHVRVADVDRAVLEWRSRAAVPAGTHTLSWSADGGRVLAAARRAVTVYDVMLGRARTTRARGRLAAAAFPPTGAGPPALLERRTGRSVLRLLGRPTPLIQTSGRYQGLAWSPDGRWLVTRWGRQWLAVRRDGRRVATVPARGKPLDWTR